VLYNHAGRSNVALGALGGAVDALRQYFEAGRVGGLGRPAPEVTAEIESQRPASEPSPCARSQRARGARRRSLIGKTPLARPLRVNGGHHTLQAILAGHAPAARRTIDVVGRGEASIEPDAGKAVLGAGAASGRGSDPPPLPAPLRLSQPASPSASEPRSPHRENRESSAADRAPSPPPRSPGTRRARLGPWQRIVLVIARWRRSRRRIERRRGANQARRSLPVDRGPRRASITVAGGGLACSICGRSNPIFLDEGTWLDAAARWLRQAQARGAAARSEPRPEAAPGARTASSVSFDA